MAPLKSPLLDGVCAFCKKKTRCDYQLKLDEKEVRVRMSLLDSPAESETRCRNGGPSGAGVARESSPSATRTPFCGICAWGSSSDPQRRITKSFSSSGSECV